MGHTCIYLSAAFFATVFLAFPQHFHKGSAIPFSDDLFLIKYDKQLWNCLKTTWAGLNLFLKLLNHYQCSLSRHSFGDLHKPMKETELHTLIMEIEWYWQL